MTEIEQDTTQTAVEATDRTATETPGKDTAVRWAGRPGSVNWTRLDEDVSAEFVDGYISGIGWLRTNPPMDEAEQVAEYYKMHRPGGTHQEGTVYADAEKLRHLVAYLGTKLEVEDGAKLKADFMRDYGNHLTSFNPPARTFAWPAMTRFYQGFELAVWHAVED